MQIKEKNITRRSNNKPIVKHVKKAKGIIVVTKTTVSAKDPLFPKKLEKVNQMLAKAVLLP